MKKIYLLIVLAQLLSIHGITFSQTVTENELFTLTYQGTADVYNMKYNAEQGIYCYVYNVPDENKAFIISNNSISDKYDYIAPEDIRFDSKGNYYAVSSDYKPDYGINNYFLIVNGKVIKSYPYIETYNSYINKNGDYVFIFKEDDFYKLGYYNPESGFRESGPYDFVKYAINFIESTGGENDGGIYNESDFYHDANGGRAIIVSSEGKAKIIFEDKEIATEYSDINESSITYNKNNELSFIAKKGARFYDKVGNEFVVSGSKEYNKFELANVPLLFNNNNEPVYIAGDSISENKYNYFLVSGNTVQKAFLNSNRSKTAPNFSAGISSVSINTDGTLNYIGQSQIIIPAKKTKPDEEAYDAYFSKSYLVKNGVAYELGYNVNAIKYNSTGQMLYSGVPDLKKNEMMLMMNYGESKIIINKKKYDEIYDYGFTPGGDIYYIGQNYNDSSKNQKYESSLYIGDKKSATENYFVYQVIDNDGSVIRYDSKGNYAYAAEKAIDTLTVSDFIITNTGRLPFPENVSESKMFSYVSFMFYSKDDKLFYIGDTKNDPLTYAVTKELFYDNKSIGKTYNSITNFKYDKDKNQINFSGSRGSNIYAVTIQL